MIKKGTLTFHGIHLSPSQIHKFRGFVGNMFKEYDLIHNHDINTGVNIYRYPLIQFKLLDNRPAIIAITNRAVEIFTTIFLKLDNIVIDGVSIPVYEKDIKVEEVEFAFSDDIFMYEFLSPWVGLNQKNYACYTDAHDKSEKTAILKRTLTGNILSAAKGLDYWLAKDQRIRTELQVREINVNLKGKQMKAFKGVFKTNFLIPDYLGLGKSVSRGFGIVRRVI